MSRFSYQQQKQASTSMWVMEAVSICCGSDQQGGNRAPVSAWSQSDLWTRFALLSHKSLVDTSKAGRIWYRSPLIWKHHSSLFFLSYSLLPLPTFCLNTDSPPSYANVLHDCRGLMQRTTKTALTQVCVMWFAELLLSAEAQFELRLVWPA